MAFFTGLTRLQAILPAERKGDLSLKILQKQQPERLQGQREDLRALRGQPGAVSALAEEVSDLLPKALSD